MFPENTDESTKNEHFFTEHFNSKSSKVIHKGKIVYKNSIKIVFEDDIGQIYVQYKCKSCDYSDTILSNVSAHYIKVFNSINFILIEIL